MDTRRRLLSHAWAQMLLVAVIVVLANVWGARSFLRLDLTENRIHSLDIATRGLMYKLDKPLLAKVYFTGGLQAPYNNHERILVDKLEDLRAYSHGMMDVDVSDPTSVRELQEEARRFGIDPIQYRYQSSSLTEMKRVYMGLALVYGDRQQVLPAITRVDNLEYELARAIKNLVTDAERPKVGWSTGHGEPDLLTGAGPLETLRNRISEQHDLGAVPLGGTGGIPEDVDALFVVGPQKPLSARALYQLDQFVMRGGSLALFVSNTKPDLRTLRPQNLYHGLESLIGHYGVQVNRDVVVDRASNGVMRFPARQGNRIVQLPINYPLIPKATEIDPDSPVVQGIDSMLFPFVSSLTPADPQPPDVTLTVLAASSPAAGRIKGIRTVDPQAYRIVAPGEERGSWPLLVSLTGAWRSAYSDGPIPKPAAETPFGDAAVPEDDPGSRLREGAPARLVISGSADFVANNIGFMLNLTDWMVQDESLISIRSKSVQLPQLEQAEPDRVTTLKAINLFLPTGLLLIFGAVRVMIRRRRQGAA